ncbi:hypothetical protein [Oscillatoria sp. FACHB-1406]|uniref:hypothetical protein n=1 Tax=Oscillatoria sp. FACHB-1406 TaxID=2692846 RepID=UPI0016868A91|nr:hypothetical protein [Oscillatoria sp. FACHB-1406]MBD2577125.1 hypothetical protein [Oscillatoria sp. FACHB-1406]
MNTTIETPSKYAICIQTEDADSLTLRKVYKILPDENAKKSGYIRVIDNEDEDYLYRADFFVFIDFAPEVERALLGTF